MQKKILIISAFPPNSLTAGQSITNSVTDDFLQKGYHVDIIAFDFPGHKLERPERFGYKKLISNNRMYKYIYVLCLFFFFPIYTSKISLRAAWFVISNQKAYDVIYLDYSQVFIYSLLIKQRSKVFMMTHDLMIQRFSRSSKDKWYKKLLVRYVYFSEKYFYKHTGHIILPSFKDTRIAGSIYGVKGIAILPKRRFKIPQKIGNGHLLKEFVFLGTWNRNENIQGLKWFIENVVPLLKEEYNFTIIGGSFPDSLKSALPPSFRVKGFVDDFSNYLQNASALISPLFLGAGIKFKVLDALCNGCRVIGTPISLEGIQLEKNGMMFLASTPGDFADAIDFCSVHDYNPAEIMNAFADYLSDYNDVADII